MLRSSQRVAATHAGYPKNKTTKRPDKKPHGKGNFSDSSLGSENDAGSVTSNPTSTTSTTCSVSDVIVEENSNKMPPVNIKPALDVLKTIRRKQGIEPIGRPKLIFNSETGVQGKDYYYLAENCDDSVSQSNTEDEMNIQRGTRQDDFTEKEGEEYERWNHGTEKGKVRTLDDILYDNTEYFARIKNAKSKVSSWRK